MQKDNSLKFIAFVCTGNTCRSPMAEGIFNKAAEERGLSVRAVSFGMAAVDGMPPGALAYSLPEHRLSARKYRGVERCRPVRAER